MVLLKLKQPAGVSLSHALVLSLALVSLEVGEEEQQWRDRTKIAYRLDENTATVELQKIVRC